MIKTASYLRRSRAILVVFFLMFFSHTHLQAQMPNAWINEIHYDNAGTDVMEGVEIVVEDATAYDLNAFVVTLYNGDGGNPYKTIVLAEALQGDPTNGFTFYTVYESLQNDLEGIALSYRDTLLQFLSYEGTLTATEGVAKDSTSIDIGVREGSQTPVGYSLQLSGIGNRYKTFIWEEAAENTFGSPNNNQQLRQIDGPEPVTDLKQERIAPDKVEISWTKPIGVHREDWDGVLLFASGNGPNNVKLVNKDFTDFAGGDNIFGSGTTTENGYTVVRRQTNTHVTETITGLEAGTTYHFVAYTAKIISGSNDDIFSNPSDEIIIAPAVANVTNFTATPLYERVRLEWENPKGNQDWWEEVMVVASESEIVFTPTQATYTADTQFGQGEEVGQNTYVVYRGRGQQATIQDLENQKEYYFKIFVQYVNPSGDFYWSTGVTTEATPDENRKLWTGNAGTNLFSDASNWLPEGTPLYYHDVILNHDHESRSYEVIFPTDAGPFELNSLKILPSPHQPITVKLMGDLTLMEEDEALVIGDYGTLINSGNSLTFSSQGEIALQPKGHYVHNTSSAHTALLNRIKMTDGGIPGKITFDVPSNASYASSLAGRTFQNLVLTASTHNPSYQVSGSNNITIIDTLLIDTNAKLSFSSSSNSVLMIKGDLIVNGEMDFKNTILFDGMNEQHIASNRPDGLVLQNIEITKPQGNLILHTDLHIGTHLTFEEGIIQTQKHYLVIDYSTNPTIHIAPQNTQIIGNFESIQQMGTEEVIIEAADLTIGAGEDDLGTISVIRRTGVEATIENDGAKGIQRNWEIHAQLPLNSPRELTFSWNEGEDEDVDLSNVKVWKKAKETGKWVSASDFMDGTQRLLTVTVEEFTQFTIADAHNPLPIRLRSFSVSQNQDFALLQWTTASETNNMGFEIEKSNDGRLFLGTGYVQGKGDSSDGHEYKFTDELFDASAYYRLKQIDFNGEATYSPIRYLPKASRHASIFKIAPNPITKGAQLQLYTSESGNSPIVIEHCILYSSTGLLVYENNATISDQLQNELNLIFTDLPKGLYILQLISNAGNQKIKLWKD